MAVRGIRIGTDTALAGHRRHLRRHRGDRRSVVVPAARRRVGALRHRLHPAGPPRAAAATFAALLTHGLGRTVGAAAAFVAVLSYNCVQIGLYGLLGADARGAAGRPVVGVGARRVDGCGGDRLSGRHPRGAGRGRRPHPRAGDDRAVRRRGAHPSRAGRCRGGGLQPWSPDLLAADGVGGVLAFGVAAFLGFETTAAFGEEVRSDRSVGRATGDVPGVPRDLLRDLGVGAAVAVGPDHIVDAARDPSSGIPFSVLAHRPRPVRAVGGHRRGHLAGGLGARRDDRVAPGRRPVRVRARARTRRPPCTAFFSSPLDNSLRTGRRHRLAPPGQHAPIAASRPFRRCRSADRPPVRVGAGGHRAAGLLRLDPIATGSTTSDGPGPRSAARR